MSSRITLYLPLLDFDSIVEALKHLKEKFTIINNNELKVHTTGYYKEILIKKVDSNRYSLFGEDIVMKQFTKNLAAEYKNVYETKMLKAKEEERKRMEEERIRYVEQQRAAVVANAKKMGYSVKETIHGEEIKIVLVRRTYN